MDGEAWRGLSVNERRMLDALLCHHFRYHQKSNGELEISYNDFKRAGIPARKYVAVAKARLIGLGLISVKRGVSQNPHLIPPNLYEITFCRKPKGFQESARKRFVWIPVEVMDSPSWFCLSIKARRIMDRLLIENMRHKGQANGHLQVSYKQFLRHGIPNRTSISRAIRELEKAGLLVVTKSPRRGLFEGPNLYRITFLGTLEGPAAWQAPPDTIPFPERPKRQSVKSILADDFKRKTANER